MSGHCRFAWLDGVAWQWPLASVVGGFPPELGAMAGQSMAADAGAIAGAERRGQAMGRVADTTASMMSGAMNSPSPAAMPMAKDMID